MPRLFILFVFFLPMLAGAQSKAMKTYPLMDGKASIAAPESLTLMSKDKYEFKYRNKETPMLALTDEFLEVNLIVHQMEQPIKPEQMNDFNHYQIAQVKKKRSDAVILGSGVKLVNGKKVGWIKFVVKAVDQKVYNHIFFIGVGEKALLFNFNCIESKQAEWAPIADAIMSSLVVK